ncbi:LytR/AlgR family response regulator transcription factor [Pseudoalteromonas luteoviolacea]|uniref:HTH LytTR-type domain-containing protein n=1 Tax=Pseudoalteromonas luteoviolacea S4060-1 TaxID=1365257 RepID=A0A161Z7G9_9GAMM|nr:LytTR family DNA-binding domain-containing protein [Pseudoalteromonas luteoviolacea]KZN64416.1 hypothetical protein N478_22230 [Pseudoalteromonas luteoviolacea S4060-1]
MGHSILNNLRRFEDYQLILIGWLFVLAAVCLNCTAHSLLIAKEQVDIISSIGWSLKEFGVWLIMTPPICFVLNASRNQQRPVLNYAVTGFYAIGFALFVSTFVDVYTEELHWQESLFYSWHKHVIAFIAIVVVWKMMRGIDGETQPASDKPAHTHQLQLKTSNAPCLPASTYEQAPSNQGSQSVLKLDNPSIELNQDEIYVVQACGNYLEIKTNNNVHLVRKTLKELEQLLDDGQFVRCHRSYLVNLSKIHSLKNHRSGHGDLCLSNGEVVPVSKSKRATVREALS